MSDDSLRDTVVEQAGNKKSGTLPEAPSILWRMTNEVDKQTWRSQVSTPILDRHCRLRTTLSSGNCAELDVHFPCKCSWTRLRIISCHI